MGTREIMEQANTVAHTDNLLEYLGALTGSPLDELAAGAQNDFFTAYLLQLPDERFSANAWSKAISVLFSNRVRFNNVVDAKIWLCQRAVDRL